MLAIFIPSTELCLHQKNDESVNGRTIFVIVVVERWASFYRIHDRHSVLAADIS